MLPSPDLLIALYGSTASASLVQCARDLVTACAWGTDSAACNSCGVDTVLPAPGTTCQSPTVASVCQLPSDDLADVLGITVLSPAPPKSPPASAPPSPAPPKSPGCGGGCIGGIVGGIFVPVLVLVLYLSGAFAPKCPSPLKRRMQTPKSMVATATASAVTHVSITAAEE